MSLKTWSLYHSNWNTKRLILESYRPIVKCQNRNAFSLSFLFIEQFKQEKIWPEVSVLKIASPTFTSVNVNAEHSLSVTCFFLEVGYFWSYQFEHYTKLYFNIPNKLNAINIRSVLFTLLSKNTKQNRTQCLAQHQVIQKNEDTTDPPTILFLNEIIMKYFIRIQSPQHICLTILMSVWISNAKA